MYLFDLTGQAVPNPVAVVEGGGGGEERTKMEGVQKLALKIYNGLQVTAHAHPVNIDQSSKFREEKANPKTVLHI